MEGKYGYAVFLPNVGYIDDNFITLGDQRSTCLDNRALCPNGMTLSFWFKSSQQNQEYPSILSSTTIGMYMKYRNGNLQLQVSFPNDTHIELYSDATMPMITMETWHLLTFTYSGKKSKLYYDGCLVKTNPRFIRRGNRFRAFTLGCNKYGEAYFRNCPRNYYDDFRFWKTAKSPRFINWLWQN